VFKTGDHVLIINSIDQLFVGQVGVITRIEIDLDGDFRNPKRAYTILFPNLETVTYTSNTINIKLSDDPDSPMGYSYKEKVERIFRDEHIVLATEMNRLLYG